MARNPNPHQDPLRCPECGGGLNGEDLAYGLVCDRCGVRVAGPFEDAHDVPDYVSVEEVENNPPITTSKGVVKIEGKKLKELAREFGWTFPDENVLIAGPIGNYGAMMLGIPPQTMHVYVFSDPKERNAYGAGIRDGSAELVLFRPQNRYAPMDVINEPWKRRKGPTTKMLAIARVIPYDEELYVDMMSVRPTARHNRVNAALIATLMDEWPNRPVSFSTTTRDGDKFVRWLEEQGVRVTDPGRRK